MEGVSLDRIAKEHGTPTYVYSAGHIRERYRKLGRAFTARGPLVCYSLKANSNLGILRLLAREGAGADVVSGGELKRALLAGFKAKEIVFSGVGKTREEMASALRSGVLMLNVESAEELEALARTARGLRIPAPVSVRVNPDVDPGTHRHVTTGRGENKFGVDVREAYQLYLKARRSPWLRAAGIQCHIGSQILKSSPYVESVRVLLRLIRRLEGSGIRPRILDIGGGMGISYSSALDGSRPTEGLDIGDLAGSVLAALKGFPSMRLLVEPGRYLVAEAGLLLTRVLYRKAGRRARFLVVDAAMNDLIRPALYEASHPVVSVRKRAGAKVMVDVVGPVCESADYLAKGVRLPWARPGEMLAVLCAGAYGFSMSSQYNSRPRAAEVLVEGRRARLVGRRETFQDLIRREL